MYNFGQKVFYCTTRVCDVSWFCVSIWVVWYCIFEYYKTQRDIIDYIIMHWKLQNRIEFAVTHTFTVTEIRLDIYDSMFFFVVLINRITKCVSNISFTTNFILLVVQIKKLYFTLINVYYIPINTVEHYYYHIYMS